jgi:hypothetical protein
MPQAITNEWDSRLGATVQRYMRGDETLRITAFNAASGVRLRMSGRRFDPSGELSSFSDQLTPTTNRVATVFDKPLTEGWLLSVAVRMDAGAPLDGQCFVIVELGLGTGNQFVPLDVLASDTISAARRVAWPGSPLRGSLDGAGAIRSITGTTPGAGAEVSETVPTGARWELITFSATLTTAVAVANRFPTLSLDDGASIYFQDTVTTAQAASTVIRLIFAEGNGFKSGTTNNIQNGSIPMGNRLAAGHRIKTATQAIQAADQYSAVQYVVREWIEGA